MDFEKRRADLARRIAAARQQRRRGKVYPPELRRDIDAFVRDRTSAGRSLYATARDLGLTQSTLARWQRHGRRDPGLPVRDRLLDFARPGDAIVVWRLDRLGRSLRDLIDIVTRIGQRGIALRSLHGSIDTATPAGKLTFHVFAALSEFERDVLRQGTRAGLAAARTRGARLGRPRALTPEQLELARTLLANPNHSARQVARQLGVHRATLHRNLAGR